MTAPGGSGALAAEVAAQPWYHTIDLGGGVVTPGSVDLRAVAPRVLPDDLSGLRCLDVGTFDGFWAFELERRGAASVAAVDVEDPSQVDLPPPTRDRVLADHAAGEHVWGAGFALAHRALGSRVQRVVSSIYDLAVEPVDLVFCGALLQHLRDPVRGLERMRSLLAPDGRLLVVEQYEPALDRWPVRRRPVAEFRPLAPGSLYTWWMANRRCLADWIATAGFRDVQELGTHAVGRGARLVALRARP